MTRGEKKFLITFGLTLALWRIIELPAVQNAFIQFLTVGQVPGLNRTLSPKQVFLVLASLFSVSLVLIFWSNLKRSVVKHRHATPAKVATVGGDKAEIGATQDVVLKKRRFAEVHIPAPKLNLKDNKWPALYVPSLRPLWRRAQVVLRKTGVILRKAAAAEYDSLKTIFTFIWKVLKFVALFVWRFAEPRIRKFDKWLDRKLHKNHVTSEILEILEECWRAVTASRPKTEKPREAKRA